MNLKISPIFCMGNKRKLIKKGLIDLFPKDINVFVEPFAGSGVVSMNVKANKYILNDSDKHIFDLYNMFKTQSANEIIIEKLYKIYICSMKVLEIFIFIIKIIKK